MAISKVVVVDGNNLTVRIDRGVAGRGVTDVEPVEIDNALYLEFFFSDGTTETVGPVGTIQYIGQAPIVVNASTISLSTVPVNLGGTGQVTANAGFNALAPLQTSNAGKYLKTDGTNAAWDLLDISTADITGVLPIANGGTNAATAADARTNLNAANQDTTISAGTGLSGGGSLAANRTISIANTAVTAASYGAASKTLTTTVNAQGQLTALAETPIAIANTQITGLGTMSTQDANAVAITGGSITGITDLAVADGGTGASTAAGARTNLNAADQDTTISAGTGLSGGGSLAANRTLSIANTAVTAASYGSASDTLTATVNAQGQLTALAATPIAISNTQISGLGTMSTQNSNAVTITGGSITGITDLAIVDGGTGASTAADARSNLGLGTAAVLNAGVANGVATLDAGGTVPLSQIPASIQGGVSYQGAWNASTNTPTLTSSVGTKGHYYVVSVSGNTNLNGVTDWLVGDWAIYNGSAWEKIDNTDQVASVNGYTGVVVLSNTDVGAPSTSLTISAGTGLSGGGDLTTNRTLSIANTAVSAGSYGTASAVPSFTVNGQGQLTAAANTTIAIANTQVSGLGTMSTQNANAVAITGGTATLTSLTVNDNTTLGSSNTDEVNFTARIASEFTPSTANTYDLGKNSHEWRDLYLTGTANISALTASGAVTLSGGTANGVAYLNGSKVLTTGSALTFDGTTLGTSGLTVSTNRAQFKGNTSTGFTGGSVEIGYTGTVGIVNAYDRTASAYKNLEIYGNDIYNYVKGSNAIWDIAGIGEAMRLTSTGLGIGTSSPSTQLQIAGSTFAIMRISAGAGDNNARVDFGTVASPDVGRIGYNNSTNGFTFRTNGSDVMTLDSSGNLTLNSATANGVGYFNGSKVLTSGSALTFDGTNLALTTTGAIYKVPTAGGSLFDAGGNNGIYILGSSNYVATYVAGSEQMRLTSTGLGIGTTSFGRKLVIGGAAGSSILALQDANTGYELGDGFQLQLGSNGDVFVRNYENAALIFSTNNTERMRLDSSGNVGIGTSSPVSKLSIEVALETALAQTNDGITLRAPSGSTGRYALVNFSGSGYAGNVAQIGSTTNVIGSSYADSAGVLIASTKGTSDAAPVERMRIDSSGNVGIGTSSPAVKLEVLRGSEGEYLRAGGDDTGNNGRGLRFTSSTNSGFIGAKHTLNAPSAGGAIAFATASTERAVIDSSGNLGIGTSSPAQKLVLAQSGATSVYQQFLNNSSSNIGYIGLTAGGDYVLQTNNAMSFSTGASYTERMRLDASGNLGLGVTPSAWSVFKAFEIGTAGISAVGLQIQTTSNTYYNGSNYIYKTTGAAGRYVLNGAGHQWDTAPSGTAGDAISFSQVMTLTAAGDLGIGTSSPSGKLHVAGQTRIQDSANAANYILIGSGENAPRGGNSVMAQTGSMVMGTEGAAPLIFITNAAEGMRLDADGNLGLGVTPSAWYSTYKAIQIGSSGALYNAGTSDFIVATNAYVNASGTYTYLNTNYATNYEQYNGKHQWFTAPSGTAGDAISFTQAMTLDASGNLGIGTSSPSVKLQVQGSAGSNPEIRCLDGTVNSQWYAGSDGTCVFGTYSNHPIVWRTNGSERARITSGGDLLVGTTSSATNASAGIKNITSTTSPSVAVVSTNSTSGGNSYFSGYSTDAGAYRFYVNNDGVIHATNTTISAISDIRFKENIRDLNVGLAEIMALKPRLYDWKEGKGADIKNARGFIAQEFEQVFPDLIDEWKDPAPEGEEPYKSVRQDLIPVLVKAIQEQQAIIDSLKARLDAANL